MKTSTEYEGVTHKYTHLQGLSYITLQLYLKL